MSIQSEEEITFPLSCGDKQLRFTIQWFESRPLSDSIWSLQNRKKKKQHRQQHHVPNNSINDSSSNSSSNTNNTIVGSDINGQ